jgi:predicted negative regulator of RcsB-dependent stress response
MNKLLKQAGFGAVEAILLLAVVGVLGFIGWRVYDQNKNADTPATTTQNNTTTPIESAEDLDSEVDELNSQNIDEQLDTSEIDAALE